MAKGRQPFLFKYLCCGLLTLVILPNHAIVPINDKIVPEQGLSGNIGITIDGQSGNKDEREINIDNVVRFREDNNLFVFIGDYTFSETNAVRDEDELFLHARWISLDLITENVDLEVFTQYQYDDFADLSNRELVGSNIRYRNEISANNYASQLVLGAGVFYETESSESTGITDDTFRANLYARYVYDHDNDFDYSISMTTYIQPAVSDASDLRLLALGAVNFPINEAISVGFEIEIKHNSDPFVDVEKTDIEYGLALTYEF